MSERIQHARDAFGPQLFKTFEGALNSFMESECPQIGGLRTRQTLVGAIAQLVHAHFGLFGLHTSWDWGCMGGNVRN